MASPGHPLYGSNPNYPQRMGGAEPWNDIPEQNRPVTQGYTSSTADPGPHRFDMESNKAYTGGPPITHQPVYVQPDHVDNSDWILFAVGWIFPFCWFAGAFRPLCRQGRNLLCSSAIQSPQKNYPKIKDRARRSAIVGLVLRPRFPQTMNMGFWIGNVIGSILWIIFIIIIAVVVSKHNDCDDC